MNLANLISLARLISVPIVVWAILADEMGAAFGIFVLAGLSDAVDGFIAKRFNKRSVLGSYLDPLADKALLVSVYVTLGYVGDLPNWLVILVVFRDVLIIGGVLLLYTLGNRVPRVAPLFISKANTVAQVILAAVALGGAAFGLTQPVVLDILVWCVAVTTVLSGASYLVKWSRQASSMEDAP